MISDILTILNFYIAFCYAFIGVMCVYYYVFPIEVVSENIPPMYRIVLVGGLFFFVGCGLHHMEMGFHISDQSSTLTNGHGIHFLFTEVMQVIGTGVWIGSFMYYRSQNKKIRMKVEEHDE